MYPLTKSNKWEVAGTDLNSGTKLTALNYLLTLSEAI
jgi:hypothetical protein